MPGEPASYKNGKFVEDPGKAVLVLKIEDPGFQDFRKDATCIIRPQSLIGEKFVDCRTTLPRAPGTEPPPALTEVPDGDPGAGQHLLPIEQNSTSVDPDLVNNISRLPYAQKFRLILNEIGGTLAGRGEDIGKPSNAPTRPCGTPAGSSRSSPTSATSWPSSRSTPSRSSSPSPPSARTSPASSPTPGRPPKPAPNAGRNWKIR